MDTVAKEKQPLQVTRRSAIFRYKVITFVSFLKGGGEWKISSTSFSLRLNRRETVIKLLKFIFLKKKILKNN